MSISFDVTRNPSILAGVGTDISRLLRKAVCLAGRRGILVILVFAYRKEASHAISEKACLEGQSLCSYALVYYIGKLV